MSRQARVGLLVLAGVVLFLGALFILADRSFLLSDTFFVQSRFSSVAGLQAGGAVQYQGVNIGRVETVQLPEEPGGQILVRMAIQEEARHLIRKNTQAQIKSEGLVGNQIVVLVPAAQPAEPVEDGGFIPGVPPFDLFEITDRAMTSVQRFEQAAVAFEQIMLDVRNGEGTLGKIIYDPTLYDEFVQTTNESRRVINNLADNAEALVGLAGRATEGVEDILNKINNGEGTLAQLINDPVLYDKLLATADTLQTISTDLRGITNSAENAANWGALGTYRFAQLMEAARHNFLFKRYFEERGYMEAAPFEVRERALEETYRRLQERERELLEWEQRLKALEARVTSGDSTGVAMEVTPPGEAAGTPADTPADTPAKTSTQDTGSANQQ
ncbi:MAG: MCE family protein [Bacteroidetes bacterium]|nr:mammalian cell entry protein [Rhodothermaceae bacterium RA]RMH63246.1 MAG: MCE family protein [Bacteroidota bacterium]